MRGGGDRRWKERRRCIAERPSGAHPYPLPASFSDFQARTRRSPGGRARPACRMSGVSIDRRGDSFRGLAFLEPTYCLAARADGLHDRRPFSFIRERSPSPRPPPSQGRGKYVLPPPSEGEGWGGGSPSRRHSSVSLIPAAESRFRTLSGSASMSCLSAPTIASRAASLSSSR